jgi:serine protease Do
LATYIAPQESDRLISNSCTPASFASTAGVKARCGSAASVVRRFETQSTTFLRGAALSLTLLLASNSLAEDVQQWIRQRVKMQRGETARERVKIEGPLFRAPDTKRLIPDFTGPTSLAPLIAAVKPAVVNIAVQNAGTSRSVGSGFIVHPSGLVLTNHHVIKKAELILVRLADGRAFDAVVIGRDEATDLALLRLPEASALEAATLGDSDVLEVGDWVVAIGNPFGFSTSVSHGLISARERELEWGLNNEFLQTDVPMNPGNSGGPLFNMNGEVIGVSTATLNQGQGVGFAVPINLVKELLPNLLDNGRVDRGWLGLRLQNAVDAKSIVITEVAENSPAAEAQIKIGDRILSVNGKAVASFRQVARRVSTLAPREQVRIEVLRGDTKMVLMATLANRPRALLERNGANLSALGATLKTFGSGVADEIGIEPGLQVDDLVSGGAGQRAGLAVGDIIIEINGNAAPTFSSLEVELANGAASSPSNALLLKVRRAEQLMYVSVKP